MIAFVRMCEMFSCGLIALVLTAGSSRAQESPEPARLIELVAGSMPSYWSVSNLEVIAASDLGNAVEPRRAIRFEADATPAAPLFAQSGAEGPYALVVPTVATDEIRRLYGVLDLTYRAGSWSGGAVIENPVTGLGQPLDLFDRATLELGSDEAETRLAALRDNSVAGAVAAQQAELQRLESDHAARMAAMRNEQAEQIAEAQSAADDALARLRADGEKAVTELELRYRNALAELTSGNEPVLAEARAERAKRLAAEQAELDAAVQALRDEAATAMDTLRADHAAARGALIETQRQELAEIETQLGTELRSLQRQLETAQDVIVLQQSLTAALQQRQAGADQLMAAFDAARKARRDFFARLPTEWAGQVRCVAKDGASGDQTYPINLTIKTIRSDGIAATVSGPDGRSQYDAEIVLAGDGLAFPLPLRFQGSTNWPRSGVPDDFDLSISQDGRMTASADTVWTVSNREVPVTCSYQLSS
jgi:hypothetical protein